MIDQEYAGFWIRFGALLIDFVIGIIVITVPLSLIYGEQYWLGDNFINGFWELILGYVVPIVATIWFWLRFHGTPGKMATKLEIVDARSGNGLSLSQALIRYIAYIPAMLPLALGFIWVGIDKKKQGWHDKIAGTVVIKNNRKEPVKFNS